MSLFTVSEALCHSDLNVQNINLTRNLFRKVGQAWLEQRWHKYPSVGGKGQLRFLLVHVAFYCGSHACWLFKSIFWPFVSMFLYSHNLAYREHFSHIGFMKKCQLLQSTKLVLSLSSTTHKYNLNIRTQSGAIFEGGRHAASKKWRIFSSLVLRVCKNVQKAFS